MRSVVRLVLLFCLLPLVRLLVGSKEVPSPTPDPPAVDELVQRLGPQTLRARTADIFPSAYITLLSIVQGLNLALLVQQYVVVAKTDPDRFLLVAQMVGGATVIFIVYYMYVWFVLVARWPPTALDSLIPFGLGAVEAFLILQLGKTSAWLVAVSLVQAVAALAFTHSLWRLVEAMFDHGQTYTTVHRLLIFLVSVQTAGALAVFLWIRLVPEESNAEFTTGLVTWAIVASAVVCIIVCELALARVYQSVGLRWIRPLRQHPAD